MIPNRTPDRSHSAVEPRPASLRERCLLQIPFFTVICSLVAAVLIAPLNSTAQNGLYVNGALAAMRSEVPAIPLNVDPSSPVMIGGSTV